MKQKDDKSNIENIVLRKAFHLPVLGIELREAMSVERKLTYWMRIAPDSIASS